jgi:hypothetical protein
MDFNIIKQAVAANFNRMSKGAMFRTSASKDDMWATYLQAFPEGTNPIYKERTEHDCTCCRQFIKAVGNAVSIVDGNVVSIWDVTFSDPAYKAVADAMSAFVKSHKIDKPFHHIERTAGTDKNLINSVNGVVTFTHFFVNIPNQFVIPDTNLNTKVGKTKTQLSTMMRGLTELKLDAVDTVLELIAQGSLYRGAEHKHSLEQFRKALVAFPAADQEIYVWQNLSPAIAGFRNTVIGSLVTDLSNDVDLEDAVKMFESKVAPTNYKRTTALVTKKQIEQAKVKIEELGLTSALNRRYAKLTDITVNNILFANRDAKKAITGDVFSELSAKVAEKPKAFDKVEEVGIEAFIKDILPKAKTLEVLMQNEHKANLVTLLAAEDPTAAPLFKWNNQFSWDYEGGVADSIKMRVAKAGGNVTGELCCRLAWENTNDLDFHMVEPCYEIYFGNRSRKSPLGGVLDVDANGGSGMMEHPVENIYYSYEPRPVGTMKLAVHNFSQRSTLNPGFEVEIDHKGQVYSFVYDKPIPQGKTIDVAQFSYKDGALQITALLPMSTSSKQVWNVGTNVFQQVNVMMLSPNHWDGETGIGNKHYFFMLDGCQKEGPSRGFYNEFLNSSLEPHRRVMELVGSKMSTQGSDEQLSGLGFSTTQRNSLLVRVTGTITRTLKINF